MSTEPEAFLVQHRCAALEFTISGPLLPISILDQMRRGVDFVDAALQVGILGPNRPPLLVAGAGAGGVSAALHAARKGLAVVLVDKQPFPFRLQRECRSRKLHPYQYEWPKDGWDHPVFPAEHDPRMPLRWSADKAWKVAEGWQNILEDFEVDHMDSFQYARSTTWTGSRYEPDPNAIEPAWDGNSYPTPPPGLDGNRYYGSVSATFEDAGRHPISADPSGRSFPLQFSCILNATGFGHERRVDGGFRGLDFWDNDNFEDVNLGISSPDPVQRVVIGGSGDGALQDFLRIATGKSSAAEIYHYLFDGLGRDVLQDFRRKIARADRECKPELLSGMRGRIHDAHLELDRVYSNEIQNLLKRDKQVKLRTRFKELLRHSQAIELLLVYPCNHLTPYYGLNRFLLLLCRTIVRFDSQRYRILTRAKVGLANAHGIGDHTCPAPEPDPGPGSCRNLPHRARFAPFLYCTGASDPAAPVNPPLDGAYHLVIVRHGVVFPPRCPYPVPSHPPFPAPPHAKDA